jgi:protoheme IX farnesyltransferase
MRQKVEFVKVAAIKAGDDPSPPVGIEDFLSLTKPTITLLVVITAIPSLLLASAGMPNPLLSICTLVGLTLTSASAAAFNHLLEADVDIHMARTKQRSIAAGRVSKNQGIAFASILGCTGLVLLYFGTQPLAAALALGGHLFYSLVYTKFLKSRTPQNIVIGGVAGAMGPLIGWAAVTNTLEWPAWMLFAIITLWTPPHFWALALKYKLDYARAGIPMYPVIYGDEKTRKAMMLYTFTLFPPILALFLFEKASWFFLVTSLLATGKFCWDAVEVYRAHNNEKAMRLFHYSCLYIFWIFIALVIDWCVATPT